jgi:hypothetical protein
LSERIVAFALLTRPELQSLGTAFDRVWPIDETPCFGGLLHAIDEAERVIWRERDSLCDRGLREKTTDEK